MSNSKIMSSTRVFLIKLTSMRSNNANCAYQQMCKSILTDLSVSQTKT